MITTSAASSSVHLQRHTTDIRLGMTLELATSFGAAVTAYLVGYFNRNALEGLFAGFLLYSSVMILMRRGKVKDQEEPAANGNGETVIPPYEPQRYPLGLGASLIAGGLSGLLGIGGGPIKVPVMYHLHECSADGGHGHVEFHDRSDGGGQRHRLLPPRRHPGRDRCAAGGRCVPGFAAGRAAGAAHSNEIRRLSAGCDHALSRRSFVRAPVTGGAA